MKNDFNGHPDPLIKSIINDITHRYKTGKSKYGRPLSNVHDEDMIQHAYEEALDLAHYLKQERGIVRELNDIFEHAECVYEVLETEGKETLSLNAIFGHMVRERVLNHNALCIALETMNNKKK